MPWNKIRQALNEMQVTEFLQINHRVLMRNELTPKNKNILKSLNITPPKRVVDLQKTP